jgi:prepilin-type processing-associated H-X9-DG protein
MLHGPSTRGVTLIELLVVLGFIGLLVGLLLPAVQMARESARRGSCANNAKQLALGVKLHEETHRIFPTGGWGDQWVGDPDGGFGTRQPGGWIYNVLPFIEQQALREIGRGQTKELKRAAMVKLLETPIEIMHCPSRRLPRVYPYNGPTALKNADHPEKVTKSDYAINREISHERSEIIVSEIQLGRGMSKTVMVGEKSLARRDYETGQGGGDRHTMYAGHCDDIAREVTGSPIGDAQSDGLSFGGPHTGGATIAYCDGSVKFVLETDKL